MEITIEKPVERTRSESFYRALLRKYFQPMNAGLLRISMPSGELLQFGDGQADIRADIRIVRNDFFRKCLLYADVGFGEAYVDGDWETDSIRDVIRWMILNVDQNAALSGAARRISWVNMLTILNRISHLVRSNTLKGSRKNIVAHYDLSNEFFESFLDRTMTYSSAYFLSSQQCLEEAQIEKYDRLCRKLAISSGMHVLEIGGGWGGFARHAAGKYGCKVTTVTISRQQYRYMADMIRDAKLDGLVAPLLMDYRNITGKFDRIVSIEMLEAVGPQFLRVFFRKCHELLNRDGLMGLQVILCPDARYDKMRKGVDWIQKHIFPGSQLPSFSAIHQAINKTGSMILHDLEDMGKHYARTLATWRKNFNGNIQRISELGFDRKFVRKWNYYLSYCEAAFEMRNITVAQMIYAHPNNRML